MKIVALALALTSASASLVQRGSHKPLSYWTKQERVASNYQHEITIAVKQQNLDKIEAALMDVATPGSRNYRKHWTPEQVREATMGDGSDAEAAIAWLVNDVGAQITMLSKGSEYVHASASVATWEAALGCKFHWFARTALAGRADDAGTVARCDSDYTLPDALSEHVHAIFSVSNLPPRVVSHARLGASAASSDDEIVASVTPAVLNSFYNIDSNTGSSLASQAVFETSGQTFSPDDLATFQTNYDIALDPVDTDVGSHSSDRLCKIDADDCIEANVRTHATALSPCACSLSTRCLRPAAGRAVHDSGVAHYSDDVLLCLVDHRSFCRVCRGTRRDGLAHPRQ